MTRMSLLFQRLALLLVFLIAVPAPASAAFWDSYRSETLAFTPADWPAKLEGDLFVPKDKKKGPYPVVVLVHGGAWNKGDKKTMNKAGRALAEKGYAAFAVNYRLAPQHQYPAQLDDMLQALRWLKQNAPHYGLDANRVALWGYSAGGHLASLVGVQPITTDIPPIRVVIAGGAPADLRTSDAPSVRAFLGGTRQDKAAVYSDASPITHVQSGLPAFFLYHGGRDELVEPSQSERFAAALKEEGVPVQFVKIDGKDHRQAASAVKRYLPDMMGFLEKYLGPAARQ
ncbi:MAG: putative lipase/esterase [Moraxellaceae bacterium]|nr:putative lipase/esterase [Moraxellaceae bacterium]